jgi:hypothetical protein
LARARVRAANMMANCVLRSRTNGPSSAGNQRPLLRQALNEGRGGQPGAARSHARGSPAPSGHCARAAPVLLRRSGRRLGADGAGRSARAEPGIRAAAAQTCRLVSRLRAPGNVLACRGDIRLAFAAVVVRGLVTPPKRVPVLAARRAICLTLAAALRCIIGTPALERVVVAVTRIAVLFGHSPIPIPRSSRTRCRSFLESGKRSQDGKYFGH